MKQKRIFCKRLLTLLLCLAMVFTSVNIPSFTVQAAVENKHEAKETDTLKNGATYDAETGEVTFYLKVGDACYDSTVSMWYKGYGSYEEAEKNYITEGGNFIAEDGVTQAGLTENEEKTEKSVTVAVSEGTAAFLYYFNASGGRPDYEHIIVIDEDEADDNSDEVATEEQKQELKTLTESEKATVDAGNTEEYTDDSWAAYKDAVEKADAVLASESATVKEVNAALKALRDAKAGLTKEGGSVVMPEPSADAINLEEKFKLGVGDLADFNKGIGTYVNGADPEWTYEGTKATLKASKWSQIDYWGIQWAINGIDVTPGEWTVEFDIVSTIDKPAYFKVTRFDGEGDKDAVVGGLEKASGNAPWGWNLTANQLEHVKLTGAVDITGKVRFFFNLAGGVGEGTVTISNVTWTKTPGSEPEELEKAPALTTDKVSKTNGYKVGESPELTFADDETWRNAVTAVKVNNKTAADGEYTLEAGKLTLSASLFAKQNVYQIEVEAEGYETVTLILPVYAASVASENWKQEWADEFDGTELDLAKWDYEIGVKSGDDATSASPIYWGNDEKEYYTKEALKVEDGKLVITATKLTDELKSKYNITDTHVEYSSARIRTVSEDGSNTLFATTYGRIEAAMELPDATGYWPAFWMLPTSETVDIYGTWASSGELDIMEAGQTPDTVDGTIHYGSTWPNNVYSGGHYTFPEAGATGNSHVYAVEWEPGEIRWYVDDILYHIENNWYAKGEGASSNYAYPAPFDEDFYILFNLAVSGNYIGNVDPTEPGKSMKVDYVRVLKDENKDYGETPETPPNVDRDIEFFEANKKYADENGNYIKDTSYDTIKDHIVTEGDVDEKLGFWTSRAIGAEAKTDVVEKDGVKYAMIDVTRTGANNYDVQLMQYVPLAKGYTYKLSFDAYTDVAGGRSFSIAPKGNKDNGYKGYDIGITANLTDKVQSYEFTFTMSSDSNPTSRIEANIGNATGAVYIGNMKLVALSDKELEELENEKQNGKKTPLDNGEHIYNGGFDQGTGKFAYWNKEGEYEVDTTGRSMKATIISSSNIDDVALKQSGIQLLEGDDYKLTLKAKADSEKDIKVGLYSKDGTIYVEKTYHIDSEMEELVLEFTMDKEVTDEEAVLIIAFGGDTTSVEIDDVSMKRLSNRNVEWNASLLYPLGGETWSDYTYYVWGYTTDKNVPENGIVTEKLEPTEENNYNYMIFKNISIKTGYTYNLSFDIKTSADNQLITTSVQQDGTWTVLLEEPVTTTTEWQTVEKSFVATTEGAVNLKFLLSAATNQACEVSLRNVSLELEGAPYLVLGRIPAEMLVDDTLQLNPAHAVEVNADYETYTYQSSDETVATVSEDGLITAVAVGSAKITVTSGAGATKSFTIKVVSTLSKGDKTELIELLAEYKDYNKNNYTEESWKVFAKALEDAQTVVDNPDATQNDVDEALYNLEEAVAGLKPAEPDKEDLNASIAKYEDSEKYKEENYTKESWAEFAKALKDAKAVAAKADATQKEVDDALAALEAAANALAEAGEEPGPGPEKKEGLWIAGLPEEITYTGAAIKPVIQVYDGETLLKEKTDYTVTYKKNTNVGTAEVIVKGKGNYAKTHTETFNIVPKNIADEDIIAPDVYAILSKNGTVKNPKISLKYGKKTLKAEAKTKKNDYSAEFETIPKNEDGKLVAGHYTITVTGYGNYTGTREIGYDVLPNDIVMMNKVTVGLNTTSINFEDYLKDGVPQVWVESVTYGKGANLKELESPRDFVVSYEYRGVGKAAVVLTATSGSGYYGSKSVPFTVTGTAFKAKDFEVQGISAEGYTYTGSPIKVDGLTVLDKNNQKVLVKGTDYDVTYSKNTNAGKATITLTGMGGYTGKFTTTFNITKMDLGKKNEDGSGLVWTCEDSAVYTKNKAVPEYTLTYNGIPLTEKKDYKVTCKKNTAVTSEKTAEITITGIGNFTGTISETYAVTTPDASSIYAVASDVTVPKAVNKLKASLKVYEESTGKALKAGTDYEKTFEYYVLGENGEHNDVTADDLQKDTLIHATITLKGNYAGSGENATIETTFRLYETKASKLTVDKIPMQEYTGKKVEPPVAVYADKAKTQPLTKDVDYKVEYSNNVKKGTAKVTITGIGNGYGGVKTVTFKIGTKSMAENANWFSKATESITNFFKNLF